MCGRYARFGPQHRYAELFAAKAMGNLLARYNIVPSNAVLIARNSEWGNYRELITVDWGLLPPWAKGPKDGPRPINARAETAAQRPMFRNALARRRCLVAADGFYEWKRDGGRKRPYFIRLKGGEPFGMAGIWERWAPPGESPVDTVAILTCAANDLVGELHDRMPVIVDPKDYGLWMDPEVRDARAVDGVLRPFPSDRMEAYPVSERVNDPRNDDAGCVKPDAA
jgi:putative SOS response-associated peptidase YedK